jgi:HD superfamily phosphohydrolase
MLPSLSVPLIKQPSPALIGDRFSAASVPITRHPSGQSAAGAPPVFQSDVWLKSASSDAPFQTDPLGIIFPVRLSTFDGMSRHEVQLLKDIVFSPEMQRLKNTRQLSLNNNVYLGSSPTRLEHSLGVADKAYYVTESLRRRGEPLSHLDATSLVMAGLLHDVGHCPFSHDFEAALKDHPQFKNHEDWTRRILNGPTRINQVLRQYSREHFDGEHALLDNVNQILFNPKHKLHGLVDGNIDVDRLDYLLRDKYHLGSRSSVNLTIDDVRPLLDTVHVDAEKGPFFDRDAVPTLLKVVLQRKESYKQIYLSEAIDPSCVFLKQLVSGLAEKLYQAPAQDVEAFETLLGVQNNPVVQFLSAKEFDSDESLGKFLAMSEDGVMNLVRRLATAPEAGLLHTVARDVLTGGEAYDKIYLPHSKVLSTLLKGAAAPEKQEPGRQRVFLAEQSVSAYKFKKPLLVNATGDRRQLVAFDSLLTPRERQELMEPVKSLSVFVRR